MNELMNSTETEYLKSEDRGLSIDEYKKIANSSNEEKLKFLRRYWKLDSQKLIGRINTSFSKITNNTTFWLENIRTIDGKVIYYPNLNERSELILEKVDEIYIGTNLTKLQSKVNNYAEIEFVIAKEGARSNKRNPLLISGNQESLKILEAIPKELEAIPKELEAIPKDYLIEYNDQILIYESFKSAYWNKIKEELEKEQQSKFDEKEREFQSQIDEKKKKFEEKNIELQVQFEEKKRDLANKENKLNKINDEFSRLKGYETQLATQITEKEQSFTEIRQAYDQIKTEVIKLSSKIIEIKSFIKGRVEWLRKLDFITDDLYKSLLDEREDVQIDSNTIFFHDIKKDFTHLVKYIHAYTFSKGIIYPKYLIEDFLTLLRTNDFIVLSGLSGSGKTQIVKSFAEALCGVAKIIPVKPNWTSSEDLLGYYNPLQKSYLSTPFLDALIEAQRNPDKLFFICLDEMNLARVEYYFADFLSALENRDSTPEINLYSDEEAEHVLSEFKAVINILDEAKGKIPEESIKNFGQLISNGEINKKLKDIIGLNENETFISLHSKLRRMLCGVLNVPSKLSFPSNVRIIGAVNIDETTHYLSPKVLDRAHIVKFESPLRYEKDEIHRQIESYEVNPMKIYVSPIDFIPMRNVYPEYDPKDFIAENLTEWANEYLEEIGIDIGLRSIRQSMQYRNLLMELGVEEVVALNNIVKHKILPRLSLDGNKKIGDSETTIHEQLEELHNYMNEVLENVDSDKSNNCLLEFETILKKSEHSDLILNYWA